MGVKVSKTGSRKHQGAEARKWRAGREVEETDTIRTVSVRLPVRRKTVAQGLPLDKETADQSLVN